MTGFIVNLVLYASGLIALFAANFFAAMSLGVTEESAIIALLISSPFVLWAQSFCYNYLFEGFELLLAVGVSACRQSMARLIARPSDFHLLSPREKSIFSLD